MRQLAIEIFLVVAIGVALAMLGPFGTYETPVTARLLYWIGFILAGYALFRPVQTVAVWLAQETIIAQWLALLIAAALASLPLAALIGFALGGLGLDSRYLSAGFPLLYAQVLAIGIAIQAMMRLLFGSPVDRSVAVEEPEQRRPLNLAEIPLAERPEAMFFNRLPPELGDHLVCLEMQDHYVRAHTLAGNTMLLMRMRDAIAELDGLEGMQVHRSWWVARDGIRGSRRENRGLKLELTNGMVAPVSRARVNELKRRGWI
jgi:hypothetical protein